MKRHRLIETIIDPASGELSGSRVCLFLLVSMDIAWAACAIVGITPVNLATPVSTMLGVCTGAVAGVYGVNSFAGARGLAGHLFDKPRKPPPEQE
jgi:hypothetical protein